MRDYTYPVAASMMIIGATLMLAAVTSANAEEFGPEEIGQMASTDSSLHFYTAAPATVDTALQEACHPLIRKEQVQAYRACLGTTVTESLIDPEFTSAVNP